MKKKELTPEQLQKQKEKDEKEVEKWLKVKTEPKKANYFFILMIVLTVIYVVDEITSNINSSMQPQILFDFFNITSKDVNDPLYSEAINTLAISGAITGAFFVLTPFYKSLCDKYGRRLFLAINTCVFGLGMLVIMLAPNIYGYMIGVIMLSFVTPNDVQVMYIMETAPKEHRAKLCSITKAIALVSVSLIGVLRRIFLNDSLSSWRMVYLIPVIVAIAVGAASIFFVKETPVFIDNRIKELSGEKEDEPIAEDANGGVVQAFKFILKHKQIKYVAIAAFIFFASTVYTSYYTTIMEGGTLTTEQVTTALIVYPFFNGIVTFFSGFLSDKMGRKKSSLILGTFAMVLLAGFILSVKLGWGPIATGICYGASIGGLWSVSDTLFITIPGESVPTNIRASIVGTISLLGGLGMVVGMVIVVVGQNFFDMGWLNFAVCVPFMALSLWIMATKVAETKDVDLDTVTGAEWDD